MTATLEFTIDYKITGRDSLNSIYSGNHWSKRSAYAEKIHLIVRNAIRQAKTKTFVMDKPVRIRFEFPPDNLDIDNHAVFAKCVVDAMKGIIIRDDSKKYYRGVSMDFADRKNIRVIVEEL